jgi:hypothetical protein
MRQSGADLGGVDGGMQQKVVDILSYQDVHEFTYRTDNPYVLEIYNPNLDGKEKIMRQVREILNKLTSQRLDKLAKDLIALDISAVEKLRIVVDMIVEKAIDEPAFRSIYANLCMILSAVRLELKYW